MVEIREGTKQNGGHHICLIYDLFKMGRSFKATLSSTEKWQIQWGVHPRQVSLYKKLHNITSCYIMSRYVTLHCHVTSHFVMSRYIKLHDVTFRLATKRYVTSRHATGSRNQDYSSAKNTTAAIGPQVYSLIYKFSCKIDTVNEVIFTLI